MSLDENIHYKQCLYEKPIGYYELSTGSFDKKTNHFIISVYKKPKFINRFFMKFLLGFKYKEYK